MKAERLFAILNLVDEDLVEEATAPPSRRDHLKWFFHHAMKYTMAACLGLLLLSTSWDIIHGSFGQHIQQAPAASAPASPSHAPSVPAEPFSFLSYEGPVLPMIVEEHEGVEIRRNLSFDLSQKDAGVTDLYTLSNTTDHDITLSALYPVTGSLSDIGSILPTITAGEQPLATTLYTGRYAGTFTSAYGSGDDSRRDNLLQPSTWDRYHTLMTDENDAAAAQSPVPVLEESVTVYEFGDFVTREDYDAATIAVEFTMDPAATSVMTYGISGAAWDEESGWRRCHFFLPNGQRRDILPKLLILRGKDMDGYTLSGYTDGSCETPLPGLSCSVERYETTIGALLKELCQNYLADHAQYNVSGLIPDPACIPPELLYRCVSEIMTEYGVLSSDPAERYQFGMLYNVFEDALIFRRIFYTAFSVTVPAGESISVSAQSTKAASVNFYGTDRSGIIGHDLLTDEIPTTLTIKNAEKAAFGDHNLPSLSAEKQALSPNQHYYFEQKA